MSRPFAKASAGNGAAPVTGAWIPIVISFAVTPVLSPGPLGCAAGPAAPPPPPVLPPPVPPPPPPPPVVAPPPPPVVSPPVVAPPRVGADAGPGPCAHSARAGHLLVYAGLLPARGEEQQDGHHRDTTPQDRPPRLIKRLTGPARCSPAVLIGSVNPLPIPASAANPMGNPRNVHHGVLVETGFGAASGAAGSSSGTSNAGSGSSGFGSANDGASAVTGGSAAGAAGPASGGPGV